MGTHAHDIVTIPDLAGGDVRAGAHCAMPLLKCSALLATCRVSPGTLKCTRRDRCDVRVLVRAWQLLA
nr:aminotransferase class V-fold PLP-dependent enzyme [Bradyrhizobium sp. SUTN9-2]